MLAPLKRDAGVGWKKGDGMKATAGPTPSILRLLVVLGLLAAACDGGGGGEAGGEEERAEVQELVVGWDGDEYTTEGDEADVGQYPLNDRLRAHVEKRKR